MKRFLIGVLSCPVCSDTPLQLDVLRQQDEEIVDGTLSCPACGRKYPVVEGIPRMIPERIEIEVENTTKTKLEGIGKHLEVRQANIAYHDAAADTYNLDVAESVHQNKFNQKRIEDIIRDLSQKSSALWFLDIGCGTGNVLKFGKKYFQHAIGTDVSVNMLKLAHKNGMEVIQADALFLPFVSNTFDVVSMFSVLHHIYDYPQALKGANSILKKDGLLYTDWDPQQCAQTESKFSLRFLELTSGALKRLKLLKNIHEELSESKTSANGPDFRKEHPEFEHLYRLAEYHEKKQERGLDPALLKQALLDAGFKSVSIKGHWQGRSFAELDISFLQRIYLKLKGKLSKQPIDRFMENVMVIGVKD